MKCSREFLFLAGFLICSCSEPDPRMAELQRYYAQRGEGINPPVKKVETKVTSSERVAEFGSFAEPDAFACQPMMPTGTVGGRSSGFHWARKAERSFDDST